MIKEPKNARLAFAARPAEKRSLGRVATAAGLSASEWMRRQIEEEAPPLRALELRRSTGDEERRNQTFTLQISEGCRSRLVLLARGERCGVAEWLRRRIP